MAMFMNMNVPSGPPIMLYLDTLYYYDLLVAMIILPVIAVNTTRVSKNLL